MEQFDFFFGLHFEGQLHSHTDNLSKDLQVASLTKETLTKMPSDQSFDHFYANISRKSKGLLGKPTLPRKRCTSARLEASSETQGQIVGGLEVGAGTPS